jgi:hypothetical protein
MNGEQKGRFCGPFVFQLPGVRFYYLPFTVRRLPFAVGTGIPARNRRTRTPGLIAPFNQSARISWPRRHAWESPGSPGELRNLAPTQSFALPREALRGNIALRLCAPTNRALHMDGDNQSND